MRDKHAGWMCPADVLAWIASGTDEQKHVAVLGRLGAGLIVAVARHANFVQKRVPSTYTYCPVAFHLWRSPWRCDTSGFWTFGDVFFTDEPGEWTKIASMNAREPFDESTVSTAMFRDVRLNPDDVAREFPKQSQRPSGMITPAEPVPAEGPPVQPQTTDRSPLSEDQLQAWFGLFSARHPNATEAEARASLEQLFPRNRVTVERLRAVLPKRKTGRRRKNNGN